MPGARFNTPAMGKRRGTPLTGTNVQGAPWTRLLPLPVLILLIAGRARIVLATRPDAAGSMLSPALQFARL